MQAQSQTVQRTPKGLSLGCWWLAGKKGFLGIILGRSYLFRSGENEEQTNIGCFQVQSVLQQAEHSPLTDCDLELGLHLGRVLFHDLADGKSVEICDFVVNCVLWAFGALTM